MSDVEHKTLSPPTYITYLLRMQRSDETAPWRVSLHDPHTGDKHYFASLGQMMDFLCTQAGEAQPEAANTDTALKQDVATFEEKS